MTDPAVPTAPRLVPWGAVLGHRWGLLAAGGLLIAGGAIWLTVGGSATGAIFADPATGGGPAAATPIGLMVLPGLVCLGLWLRSALRLRLLLSSGVATAVDIVFQQRAIFVVPEQNHVGYEFVDREGNQHHGRQWVTATGFEGQCLRYGGIGLSVVYDPARPEHNHLVARARFAQS